MDKKPDTVGTCVLLECELGAQTSTTSAGVAMQANSAMMMSITMMSLGRGTSVSASPLIWITPGVCSVILRATEVLTAPSVSSMISLRLDDLEEKLENLAHATDKGNRSLHDKLDYSVTKYQQSLLGVKKAMKVKEAKAANTLESMHHGLTTKMEEKKMNTWVVLEVASQYGIFLTSIASMSAL